MISGHGTIETAVRATKLGASDFIEKPLSLEKIVLRVLNAVQAAPPGRRKSNSAQSIWSPLSGYRRQHPDESPASTDCRNGSH